MWGPPTSNLSLLATATPPPLLWPRRLLQVADQDIVEVLRLLQVTHDDVVDGNEHELFFFLEGGGHVSDGDGAISSLLLLFANVSQSAVLC